MKFTNSISGNQTRAFNKLKKEAMEKLGNDSFNKDELIASIRNQRMELSKKNNSYTYHDEVTEKDMIMTLANREFMKRKMSTNIQQLLKALEKENIKLKIEDKKECNNTLNVLTYDVEDNGLQFWLNDNATMEYCWDNGLLVGGSGGGIKTDKLSATIKFIIEYIKKYY